MRDLERHTDHYFINSRLACKHAGVHRLVMYQVFQRGHVLLCGMKFVLELLRPLEGRIEVFALKDGDRVSPQETVMHIVGPVDDLLEFETVYLGMLARMTRVATNVREAVEAAVGKPLLFFPARFDVPEVQEYDGYAAFIGGASGASTQAEADAFDSKAVGTMPHALIAAFKGDTVAAGIALAEALPNEPLWALVDFVNDSARTAVELFLALRERGHKLTGVRLDTSHDLVDESLRRIGIDSHGVQPE
ncbi:MAG TPA: hypothetical protein VF135_06925, partial [Terriglobales bacterium]